MTLNSHRAKVATLSGLLVVYMTALGFTGVGVAAADTGGSCDAMFDTDCEGDRLAYVSGFVSGLTDSIGLPFIGEDTEDPTAAESAAGVQEYFNNHEQDFVDDYNNRVSSANTDDVLIRHSFRDDNGNPESLFLHAEFDSDGNLVNATMKDTVPDGMVADEYIVIEGELQENAESELERFHQDYVQTGDRVDEKYIGEMYGKYRSDIDTSFGLSTIANGDFE